MNSAIGSVIRNYPRSPLFSSSSSLLVSTHWKPRGVGFRQAILLSSKPESAQTMDKAEKVEPETGDVMYHFGDGYATRCEDEGFGVIYAGKQAIKDLDEEKDTVDLMSHSFGEGYATRCEDEGFGMIYAGKQSVKDHDQEIVVNKFAFEIKESHFKKDKAND